MSFTMAEIEARVEELAELMDEFQLAEAELEGDGWKVGFKRRSAAPHPAPSAQAPHDAHQEADLAAHEAQEASSAPAANNEPSGEPVLSPMNGIYYSTPSPNAPAFVHEGDQVEEGQVVALIEAMKVFNEIVAPHAGTITRIAAQNGQLVQVDEALLFILSDN